MVLLILQPHVSVHMFMYIYSSIPDGLVGQSVCKLEGMIEVKGRIVRIELHPPKDKNI
jgi:hypothetical protein